MSLLLLPFMASAQSSSFAYQGQLATADGTVNANCDFEFGLWTAETVGTEIGTDAAAGENCTAIASCPNGKTAVGGGYFNTCIDAKALGNHPSWSGNWSATFVVPASTICTPPVKLQVFATCVDRE